METQGPLIDDDRQHEPHQVDLNRATDDDLIALFGIEPQLAEHIITYREVHGDFASTSDLANVPGIEPEMLERFADRLVVMPGSPGETAVAVGIGHIESVTERSADVESSQGVLARPESHNATTSPEEVLVMIAEEPVLPAGGPSPEEPGVWTEPAVSLVAEATAAEPSEVVPEAVVAEPAEEAPPLTPDRAPVSTAAQGRHRDWTWLWSSLLGAVLGGLLGMALALLIFAGINGAIDMRHSSAFRTLSSQASGLSVEIDAVRTDVSTLQGDIDGLRERVEVLSGLTPRMEQVESTIEMFNGEIDSLQTKVDELDQNVADLGQVVDTLEQQSAQTMSFFEQLQTLLEDVFGSKEPQGALPSPEGVN